MAVWENVKDTFEEHPYAIAGAVLALVVIIWYLQSGSSAAPAAAPASTSDANAAQLASAQIAANASTAAATLAANVQNNQTAAAQTVALAQIQGNATTAQAQAGAAVDIATLAAKSQYANEAINAGLGVPTGAGNTGINAPNNGGASFQAAGTNFKPWLLEIGDMLFGSQAQGTVAGPTGNVVDIVTGKYLGYTGGAQIGGNTSTDQLTINPNSIFYTPPNTNTRPHPKPPKSH